MASPDRRDLPGNDASWYRALLDDAAPDEASIEPTQRSLLLDDSIAPAPSEPTGSGPDSTVTEDPVSLPDDIDRSAGTARDDSQEVDPTSTDNEEADGAAPVVAPVPDLDADEAVATTSEMVGQMWTADEETTPFDDWEPDAIDRKITSSRPFRWTSVIGALAIIGLIAVGLVLLPSITRNRATAHRDLIVDALWELRSELPDTQNSLLVATEPATTVSGLNDLATQLTVLAAKASDVDDVGRTDLPAAPPFTSSEPIDELLPIQQRLEPLATTAQTIQRRISNLVEYRSLMGGFMVLPDLPFDADSATQADLRVVLASAQAQSASVLTDLPSDVSLSAHQELAREINEVFASWQIDYLEALRIQDPAAAESLVTDLNTRLGELDAALITPLAQIRSQTDADLIDLAHAIDQVLTLARGEAPAPD